MRILLLNPRHTSIGSRIPDDHLPPLGLLALGGPILDHGHRATLLDADRENLPIAEVVERIGGEMPDALLIGHSGSTSAHPVVREVSRWVRRRWPGIRIIYGGVYPTYHWRDVLAAEGQVDVIVRGEGEATVVQLLNALENGTSLREVRGIAFRVDGVPLATPPAQVIADLDRYRVGWELIDHARYSYWGGKRAVVMQFSRGCPHLCSYCGQRGFWTRWRHRDPVAFAREIARLHREQGIELVNLADENPTSSRVHWKAFCQALIAENVNVLIVGSTRAGDIVRDSDLLHLYKRAGVIRFLMGTEATDSQTLELIRKGSTTAIDREAIRLLRQHGILSMATWVVGFEEETATDYRRGMRQLLSYDPDQIQMLYVTPHRWTPFFDVAKDRAVIQRDQRRWDYKHQVLETKGLRPWQVFCWVKLTEVVLQARPRAIARLFHRDPELRHAQRWYTLMGRRVWFFEIWAFLFRDRRAVGPRLREFWGESQAHEEESMLVGRRDHASARRVGPDTSKRRAG
ncbi:anaerobic magnesium-protoporphyrin IX monomethyl ester cyclase [Panacagrimonas perspica]|uniref:Anaerobic magnesium-protoporphyrin IX monomethyl ester cyclase n=1 Tax=Panacagrimonas perspica TaxID=381431 RepID=A0A4S3K9M1_9GAMM|nr:magnesium-protoporphyrin IX monomethyl ester anaerobic oxidative cyclase [Panacagrimonas perspica]TDU28659.1 anaerobic magnesium-protoporphyrin IX monomethyl ester cyclase [Panacagrimonas perspica]THD04986.1 magnesium-protoporphyrin IX monomethyl ester anaerobic oxidative cyclase [Panacagrimonas perspica]